MKLKFRMYLYMFLCLSLSLYSSEFTIEELNELENLNMITDEEYKIILDDLQGV